MKTIAVFMAALMCIMLFGGCNRNESGAVDTTAHANKSVGISVTEPAKAEDYKIEALSVKEAPRHTAQKLFTLDDHRWIGVHADCPSEPGSETSYLADGTQVPPDPEKVGRKTAWFSFFVFDESKGQGKQLCDSFMMHIKMPSRPETWPVITDAILDGKRERMRVIVYYDPGHVSMYDVSLGKNLGDTLVFGHELISDPPYSIRKYSPGDSFYFVTPSVVNVSLEKGPRCHYALGYRYTDIAGVDPDRVFSEPEAVKKGYIGIKNVDSEPVKTYTEFFVKWSNDLWNSEVSGVPQPEKAPRTQVSGTEPSYDMSEWDGWTRMERNKA